MINLLTLGRDKIRPFVLLSLLLCFFCSYLHASDGADRLSLVKNTSYFKTIPVPKIELNKYLSIEADYININSTAYNTIFFMNPWYIGPYSLDFIPTIRITIRF